MISVQIDTGTHARFVPHVARLTFTVAVSFAAMLALAGAASAQETEEGGEGARGAVELVLDSSGSMSQDDANGLTRIEAARDALDTLIGELPEGAPVGLRVYGDAQTAAERKSSCEETTLVQPVSPLDPDELSGRLSDFDPGGKTPIGQALKDAAKDLPDGGEQVVVLVSDGLDTCAPPDPCKVAADLAESGVALRVQAIGLRVDAEARRALQCIADVTGGVYRDAEDAESLADSLRAATLRALRGYETSGEPVEGGETVDQAALIEEGQYVDDIAIGEVRWYAVDVPAGTGVLSAATVVPPTPRIDIGVSTASTANFTGAMFLTEGEAEPGAGTEPGTSPLGEPEGEEIDNEFETGLVRSLAAGEPTTVVTSTGDVAQSEGRIVFGVALEDDVGGLPDRKYPLELLVDQVGTPVEEEPDDEPEPTEPDAPEATDDAGEDGPSAALGLGVGFGAALVGLILGAAAMRRREES